MNPNGTLYPLLELIRKRALYVGLGGAVLCLLGAFLGDRHYFDRAYLFSYIFFLGLSLGSLALLMVHRQLSGAWGFLIRRPLEAGAMTLLLMVVLFIPVLLDMGRIYSWVNDPPGLESEHGGTPEASASHKAAEKSGEGGPVRVANAEKREPETAVKLAAEAKKAKVNEFKRMWLNPTWFTIRFLIYFTIWIGLALVLTLGSKRQDETGSVDLAYRLNAISAPGLVAFFLSVSFALIDWGMSLEPAWYSTIYGVLMIIGQAVSTTAFMIIVAAFISRRGELEGLDKPETFNDLGNLLLAFTMLWGYLSFSQFLIVWAGNLAEEIPWYMRRLHGGWENFGRFLIIFHFAVPFLILLARPVKRNISALWKVAALVLFAHFIDDFWLFASSPAFDVKGVENPGDFWLGWRDLVVPVTMGGIWLSVFLWFLKSKPLMIAHDPGLLPALKQASGGH